MTREQLIADGWVETSPGSWRKGSTWKSTPTLPPPWEDKPKEKRFRQDSKPLLNGLEQEWFNYFQRISPDIKLRPQAKRYRLGNGKWYKPDFTGHIGPREMAWEVKGKKSFRDAMDTIKWAAHEWPEVTFTMVWKDESGRWQEQIALP